MTARGWAVDLILAGVAFAVAFAFSYGPGTLRMSLQASLVVAAVAAGAVWLSGHRPVAALALVVGLVAALPLANVTVDVLDLIIVLVVFRVIIGSTVPVPVVGVVCFVALTANDAWQRIAFGRSFDKPSVLYPLLLTALSIGIGAQARRIRRQQAELVAFRDRDRERAVAEERRRIARDLHDVGAHHLSALIVRNKLARRIGSPSALVEAADFTAQTSAEALDAMRRVVHVLGVGQEAPLSPYPAMADLDRVIARVEAAGLNVDRSPAPVHGLPDSVQIAVVRIAQEALSNVLRHRGPGDCWLELERSNGNIVLRVEDDGTAPPISVEPAHDGFGIIGMAERARSCGGQLDVGRSPRGGWAVTAVLPVEPVRVRSA